MCVLDASRKAKDVRSNHVTAQGIPTDGKDAVHSTEKWNFFSRISSSLASFIAISVDASTDLHNLHSKFKHLDFMSLCNSVVNVSIHSFRLEFGQVVKTFIAAS